MFAKVVQLHNNPVPYAHDCLHWHTLHAIADAVIKMLFPTLLPTSYADCSQSLQAFDAALEGIKSQKSSTCAFQGLQEQGTQL